MTETEVREQPVSLAEWLRAAEEWLDDHAECRQPRTDVAWGEGSDRVAVFHNATFEEERAFIDEARRWQRLKSDAGYGSISWPREYGGAALPSSYERGFRRLEHRYVTPKVHEAVSISMDIEAPTILALGTSAQKERLVEPLRRTDELCCQLFSEPDAGSDLGSISTRAVADGDEWVINGQKVWTSGARHADWGYLIARTDPDAPRQRGMTAFIVPMRAPGVAVRPLRQMSGGSSFNEVFFTDLRLPDSARLGDVGCGWSAAMTTLGFERMSVSGEGGDGDLFERLLLLARHLGRTHEPLIRQQLVDVYADGRIRGLTVRRARAAVRSGGVPGPEGSIGKLAVTNGLMRISEVASSLLGASLVADTGAWGTFSWSEYVNGVPGMRIAGGTDEIQRNTIAERVLGLPREPRSDGAHSHPKEQT